MTIGTLLALSAIIIALYALGQRAQRRSVGMFVPRGLIPLALGGAALFLILEQVLTDAQVPGRWPRSAYRLPALILPVGALVVGYGLWKKAKLKPEHGAKFKAFLLASLRDSTFDELIRIIKLNAGRLHDVLDPDTLDLLFERRSIRAFVAVRSWIHLDLLTKGDLFKALPRPLAAVDRLVREYLAASESPVRTTALLHESGDETLTCPQEEHRLIEKSFLDPDWYRDCRADYPLVMTAAERLISGELDAAYNRNDPLYTLSQGVSSRSRCPIFLAEKVIVNGLKRAVECQSGGDFYVTDLWDILRDVTARSKYDPAVWDRPVMGSSEFPTPFAYLLWTICLDLKFLSKDALQHGDYRRSQPTCQVSKDIARTWALCVSHLVRKPECASDA